LTGKKKPADHRRVLQEGGFVIFSDDYVQSNPCSVLGSLTQEFQLANPCPIARPVPDPKADERKQRLEQIKYYIKEAEGQHRPVFRKKTSDLVYGRSAYCPAEAGEAEEEFDEPPVLFASPMPSPGSEHVADASLKTQHIDQLSSLVLEKSSGNASLK